MSFYRIYFASFLFLFVSSYNFKLFAQTKKRGIDSLNAYEQFIKIRDSIYYTTKANEFIRQELYFKYKQDQVTERLGLDQKIARQKILVYSGYTGFILVLLLAFFIFRNYNTQKSQPDFAIIL